MSDAIKHECGIALVRLRKPLTYYFEKYGTWQYGLQKMYLLMEKQHNRGQDGAGMVILKTDAEPGNKYIHRFRSNQSEPLRDIFGQIRTLTEVQREQSPELFKNPEWAMVNSPIAGELMLGHMRYGTFGKNNIENVHPVMRENNWRSRNLVLAGNFNLTNVDELFHLLTGIGQHPKDFSDTVTMLENIGHHLDQENEGLYDLYKRRGYGKKEIAGLISHNIDIKNILQVSSKRWDGGYTIAGLIGNGDAFVLRDPAGIRPAFYYIDDEIAVVTSERPIIQTVLNVPYESVNELSPGHALILRKTGEISEELINKPATRNACSFERIYFSRGSDQDIYNERKKMGELLAPAIIKSIGNDLENAVFSYIPNTAETAFLGMVKGLETYNIKLQTEKILALGNQITPEILEKILQNRVRVEKVAIKDVKLRTFITQDEGREDLVGHVYDITYGTVRAGIDKLVIIDDSIVRGTTLKRSILRILDRLNPKKIVVVSSSPQIRYPDCYGIDMAKLNDFIAFNAAVELLKDHGKSKILDEVYKKSKAQENKPKEEIVNYVKEIYQPFTAEEISGKIAEMLKPADMKAEVEIVFQTIEDLHLSCPNNKGDWYFTGNYPTPGGNKVVNKSFINFIEKKNERAY
ncbi:MAG TPA: amidophosphoribosyltransferase [Bacteroidales bacterium]|nr:amidophosphoribosyltransferase [Bacteroidales bacterium]